ncbi:MAG: hypothetical protein JOZ51_17180 [Chloroflexi bacterium]|nr:hypothetical protein [Chloroflexota bacterium]
MAINVQAAPTHKVYYLWGQKLMWAFSGMLVLLFVPWQLANETPDLFAAMSLLIGSYFLWYSLTTRLVISSAGIAYNNMGLYRVVTSWSNVERIVELPHSSGGTIRALILREPAATGWPGLDAALLPEHCGRVIPLSGSTSAQRRLWGRIDELEQEIQRYAPHVLLES